MGRRNSSTLQYRWDTFETKGGLFEKTCIGQIDDMLCLLYQVSDVIWELIHNGRLNEVGDFNFDKEARVDEDVRSLLEKLKA